MSTLNDQHHAQFLRLFAEHEPSVRIFVRSLAPTRTDASEVMQEVAVVLWQKFGEFDVTRDFRKWAFGVARFEALAFLRDRARDRHVFDEDLVGRLADEAAAAEPRHLTQREALETCLQRLPERQRELVLAAYTKARGWMSSPPSEGKPRCPFTRCCTGSGRCCWSVCSGRSHRRNSHEHTPG